MSIWVILTLLPSLYNLKIYQVFPNEFFFTFLQNFSQDSFIQTSSLLSSNSLKIHIYKLLLFSAQILLKTQNIVLCFSARPTILVTSSTDLNTRRRFWTCFKPRSQCRSVGWFDPLYVEG